MHKLSISQTRAPAPGCINKPDLPRAAPPELSLHPPTHSPGAVFRAQGSCAHLQGAVSTFFPVFVGDTLEISCPAAPMCWGWYTAGKSFICSSGIISGFSSSSPACSAPPGKASPVQRQGAGPKGWCPVNAPPCSLVG